MESITMAETMHIMAMVVDIIDLILATSAALLEGVEHFYINMATVALTKVHDMYHVPNPKKPDTMARTE